MGVLPASGRHFVWLLAAITWADSTADLAVTRQMRAHVAGIKHARVFHRSAVDANLDAVFAVGGPTGYLGEGGNGWWERGIHVGFFLQQRSNPGLIYKIAVIDPPSIGEWTVRVERVTPSEAIIYCLPEKGMMAENRRFTYDLRSKALLSQSVHESVSFGGAWTEAGRTVLIGWNLDKPLAIEYLPGADPPFRVLSRKETSSWIDRIPAGVVRMSFTGTSPVPRFHPASFGPGGRFSLRLRQSKGRHGPRETFAVYEQTATSGNWFSFPESSYGEFSAARPQRVKVGHSRAQTTIEEQIGRWQIVDGRLWFGKAFYDGEGMTGVGGFGFFDTDSRRFQIYSPPQIRDYSVTAMLVESDSLFLGVATAGEWSTYSAGVLQLSLTGKALGRIDLKEPVGGIVRAEGVLLMATSFGVALFDGQNVRRFFVDQTPGGRLRVVEAFPAKYHPAE